MRGDLKSWARTRQVLGICALVAWLTVPALPHNHTGRRLPAVALVLESCPQDGGPEGHLHAVTVKHCPPCPACAAGAVGQGLPATGGDVGHRLTATSAAAPTGHAWQVGGISAQHHSRAPPPRPDD
jgi:hypothetical protein